MRLPSFIDSVTVFQSGAEVTRRVLIPEEGIDLPATLDVYGLPLCLHDSSVSASLDSSAEPTATVVEARVRVELDPELPAQHTELAELGENLDSARRDLANAQFWLGLLSQLSIPSRPEGKEGEPPPPLAVESRLQILDFREAMTELWSAEEVQHRVRVENLEERLTALNAEKSASSPLSKMISLRIEGDGRLDSGSSLAVTYRVPGARWTPTHILNFDRDLGELELHLRALVAQQTGEDWADARLSFSSSYPQVMKKKPALRAIRIGKEQPLPPIPSWKPPPRDTEVLFQDFDHKRRRESPLPPKPEPPNTASSLTTGQKLAIVMMSLPPDHSAQLFSEVGPEAVQALSLEITKIPSLSSAVREEVLQDIREFSLTPEGVFDQDVIGTLCRGLNRFESDEGGRGDTFLDEGDEEAGAGIPLAAASAAPMKLEQVKLRRVVTEKKKKLQAPGGGGAPPRPRSKPVFQPDPTLQDYARLVIRGPYESDRGTLQHQSLLDQVLAEANRCGAPTEGLDIQVEDCIRRARSVEVAPLPPGCVAPSWPGKEPFELFIVSQERGTVPGDGSFHNLPLRTIQLKCKAHFVTVPRETAQVFRSVELESDIALPEGPSDVYVGSAYLLSGPFKGVAPDGKLRLALGVEERIEVVRNTRFEETSSGMVSKTRNLVHKIEVELHNGLARKARVEVRERVPQPRELEKDLEVSLNEIKPAWEPFEPEEQPGFVGAYRWNLVLEPGQKSAMQASYTINLPYKYELEGGNRRE